MNCGIHNTAIKMVFGELPAAPSGLLPWEDATQGSAFGSTLGCIPAAASRLKVLAISRDVNVMLSKDIFGRVPNFFTYLFTLPGRRLRL